jgi:hypothetical protein
MVSAFIYVHGPNGAGKTTLAYSLITCAGGIVEEKRTKAGALLSITKENVVFIGKYRTACGGADGVQPYSLVPDAVRVCLANKRHVFCEGLMTPGVETCQTMARFARYHRVNAVFILLDASIDVCTRHVVERRERNGNFKPYDNAHLVKKHRSSKNWANNLRAAGLTCLNLKWGEARDYCQRSFGITADRAIGLLD